jgi:hypothetical protein
VPDEKIEPTQLYEYYSRETGKFEVDAPIAIISKTLADCLARVRRAAEETDEVQRENHVSLAWSNILELVSFLGSWPSFDEALTLIFTAMESHRSNPYTSRELVTLQKVLELLRRNPVPTDDDISVIYESLDSGQFDLNAPVIGLNLVEEDS